MRLRTRIYFHLGIIHFIGKKKDSRCYETLNEFNKKMSEYKKIPKYEELYIMYPSYLLDYERRIIVAKLFIESRDMIEEEKVLSIDFKDNHISIRGVSSYLTKVEKKLRDKLYEMKAYLQQVTIKGNEIDFAVEKNGLKKLEDHFLLYMVENIQ